MFRFTIIIILVIVAALVAFVVAKQPQPASHHSPAPDVCVELREIEFVINQVAKHNHRFRVRFPMYRNDRDSNGATLNLVSVYSKIFDAERKFGCR